MSRYRFIEVEKVNHAVRTLCRVFQVSRTAYYHWSHHPLRPCSRRLPPDRTVVTPHQTSTILEGVTRHSLITLARGQGHAAAERKVAVDEWRDGVRAGPSTEVFACGTAPAITPITQLIWRGRGDDGHGDIGPCAGVQRCWIFNRGVQQISMAGCSPLYSTITDN